MQIVDFGDTFRKAANAVRRVGDALRTVRDSDGVPTRVLVGSLQTALGDAKAATVDSLMVAQLDVDKANSVLSQFAGGPETVAALQAGAVNIEAKAAAWNVLYGDWFNSPAKVTSEYKKVGEVGKEYMRPVDIETLSGPEIDALRTSKELADLIEAFEAVGG